MSKKSSAKSTSSTKSASLASVQQQTSQGPMSQAALKVLETLYDGCTDTKPNLKRQTSFLNNVAGSADIFRNLFDSICVHAHYCMFEITDEFVESLRGHLEGCETPQDARRVGGTLTHRITTAARAKNRQCPGVTETGSRMAQRGVDRAVPLVRYAPTVPVDKTNPLAEAS